MRGIEEILYMQFVMTSLYCNRQLRPCGMCCCQLLGWTLSVLPQVHFDVVSVTSGETQFIYLHAETFVCLGSTLFENCLSLKRKTNFSAA